MGGVSTYCVAGMTRLRSVAICFILFFISSPNDREGTLGFGSAKIEMMSLVD